MRIHEPVDATQYDAAATLAMPDTSGMAFHALASKGSGGSIIVDTDASAQGTNSGPEPLELLLFALGTCTGMDVITILRKKRQIVTSYTVNVYATQAQDRPRVYTHIVCEHVVGGLDVAPEAVSRSIVLSITKYCPVHTMLAKAASVEHVFRILDAAPGSVI